MAGADASFMNAGGLRADVAVLDTAALQPADVTSVRGPTERRRFGCQRAGRVFQKPFTDLTGRMNGCR